MAGPDDKVPSYRRPHEGPQAAGAGDPPREALGRVELPVVGSLDLELALGRPLRLALDAGGLEVEPGSALLGRLPELPTVELRQLRLDLVYGTVTAEADALGPFILEAAGVVARIALRRGLDWQPGRGVLDLVTQNLPRDPASGARRAWSGPFGAAAWVRLDARLALELRGDRVEVALDRPAVLRVLGLALPVLAVRVLFGPVRLEIDPGETGPVRRAILALAAWIATRWLRRRMPAAMTIPGYDLFADEQRRARLLDLVRRLRGRPRPRRAWGRRRASDVSPGTGLSGHDPSDQSAGTGSIGHTQAGTAGSGSPAAATVSGRASEDLSSKAASAPAGSDRLSDLVPASLGAARPPEGARVFVRIPVPGRGEVALVGAAGCEPLVTRAAAGVRVEVPGGLYLHADELPELAGLRVVRALLLAPPPGVDGARVRVELQTDPPLGPLLRALVRRVSDAHLVPRLSPDLLHRLGLVRERADDELVLLRQSFSPTAGIDLRTAAGAEVRLRHGAEALVVEAPDGLQIRFHGLPFLPDATLRRLEYRWQDGAIAADATPDLGEFGALALAQLVRVRAAPVLPAILGVRADGGPELDPLLEDQLPALLVRTDIAVLGRLDVRIDPDDVLAVRLDPQRLGVASERRFAVVAPDLRLALRVGRVDHDLDTHALGAAAEPALGDYLTALVARCVEHFGLVHLRPRLPLAPAQRPEAPWLLAQVPKDSTGARARIELPPGAGLVLERGPEAIEVRAEAPLQVTPEGSALLADLALESLRYRPGAAAIELVSHPPAGPLVNELLRRLFARFVAADRLAEVLRRLALPAPAPVPPPPPAPAGVVVWERSVPQLGAVKVALDPARTLDLSLGRRGAHIGLGKGATLRCLGLGLNLGVRTVDLSFLPWTVEVETSPPAGELAQHVLSHALRALFAEFMRYFWPKDRSPRAGHDTLLSLGADKGWGPLKICVARGGSIDLHLDREGLSLKSEAGLFVTGEALDWLPDFYLHELSLRFSDCAVKLAISGIVEQAYREAAAVSPVTEAVLSHLYRVLVAPRLPAVWALRLGLPRPPLPAAPPHDPARLVVFSARLPGEHGEFAVSIDPTDVLTITANEVEVAVESERGFAARMPGLRLAIQLRGARYHLETGEVQVGGLGQLENALVEALIRRSIPSGADPGASGVRGVIDRFPLDEQGRRVLFTDPRFRIILQAGTSVRVRLDDAGLKVGVEPSLVIDGLASANFVLCGLSYSFDDPRFTIDLTGDTTLASLIQGFIDKKAERTINDMILPLVPQAMRTPGYRLSRDPQLRETLAALLKGLARLKRAK